MPRRNSTPGFPEPRGAGEPGHFSTPNPGVFRPPNPGVSGWKMCGWWVENATVAVLHTLNLKLRCKDKPAITCQLVIDWLHFCISCIIYLLPEYWGVTHHSDHCLLVVRRSRSEHGCRAFGVAVASFVLELTADWAANFLLSITFV